MAGPGGGSRYLTDQTCIMSKRPHDSVESLEEERPRKELRESLVAIKEWTNSEKVQLALDFGAENIKIVVDTETGGCPLTSPKKIQEVYGNITHKEDRFIITRSKKLVITTNKPKSVEAILAINKIQDIPIRSRILEDTITSRYVIRNVDTEYSTSELAEELISDGVRLVSVTRFTKKNSIDPIPVILVKELGKTPRREVHLFRTILHSTIFEEKPRICHKCQNIGHFQGRCTKEIKCSRCGQPHDLKECLAEDSDICCARCNETSHSSLDLNKCPKYIKNKEVLNISKEKGITLKEAWKLSNPQVKTFASVTKPTTIDSLRAEFDAKLEATIERIIAVVNPQLPAPTSDIQTEITRLQALNTILTKEITSLRAEVEGDKKEREKLKIDLSNIQATLHNTQSENVTLKKENSILLFKVSELQKKVKIIPNTGTNKSSLLEGKSLVIESKAKSDAAERKATHNTPKTPSPRSQEIPACQVPMEADPPNQFQTSTSSSGTAMESGTKT